MGQELTLISADWVVYMILCSDNSLYTGITTDLPRRFRQHCNAKGAKYFRGRQPIKVVYAEDGHNRSAASKREFAIKKLKPSEKILLIASETNKIVKDQKDKL
ncbi:excinuclease ABC C subunit domain-containing protein [Methyloglobulus morosus KoM1]|uniref:Excinuclease ABC C subunit domain-containing protein n=1 Tax=Methyloglobulus morosus KoM1 TaxID=1116472 RepID=V5C209_9GAMM|nr:GIY-YIG nuclease family protein [Methyloglobulus morosus]ESS74114.1 excinuclease ABC C subunit domain-containing protein [Methyloglobulus morosus KoM1]